MNLNVCRQVKLVYLPPYSPDLNPIEEAFSFIKGCIRRFGHCFWSAVETKEPAYVAMFLHEMLNKITPDMAKGWMHHSGYL